MGTDPKAPTVEVRLTRNSTAKFNLVRQEVHGFITTSFGSVIWPSTVIEGWETNPILEHTVERIYASESSCPDRSIHISRADLQIHVFQPYPDDTYDQCTGGGDGEEEVVSATVTEMPSRGLEGLWESLIYEDGVKSKLLDYIHATMFFSDADVDCEDRSVPGAHMVDERYLTICASFLPYSQYRVMEQSGSPPRASRNRKNLSMSSPSPETFYPTRLQVSIPTSRPPTSPRKRLLIPPAPPDTIMRDYLRSTPIPSSPSGFLSPGNSFKDYLGALWR